MTRRRNNNSGNHNSGNHNSGGYNSGDCNSRHFNSGDQNSGDFNSGYGNAGDFNSGYYNSGRWNSGGYNSGNRNSGCWNSGNFNSGSWNSGNKHVGCFNSINADQAYYFNKLLPVAVWEAARKPNWLYAPSPTTWIPAEKMSAQEKRDNPDYKTTNGYLRVNDMKAEWLKAYQSASEADVEAVRQLPGFDAEVFKAITGLDLGSGLEAIVVNGVTYVRKGN